MLNCVSVTGFVPKTLKAEYFVKGVVGLFVGFPHKHRIMDGYARCRFCRIDLSIADRGIVQLYDHWRSGGHRAKEQKYRLMTGKPLLNKSCRPMNEKDVAIVERELMDEPPVYLESPLGVSLEERIAMEDVQSESPEQLVIPGDASKRLWLSILIDQLVGKKSIESVVRGLEMWFVSMRQELTVDVPQMSHVQTQVIHLLVDFKE